MLFIDSYLNFSINEIYFQIWKLKVFRTHNGGKFSTSGSTGKYEIHLYFDDFSSAG